MKDTLDKLYGLILLHSQSESLEIFSNIKEEWNLTGVHKALHTTINELVKTGGDINILTVSDRIMKGGHDKKYILEASKMTSSLGSLEIMYVDTLLNWMEHEFHKRRASITGANITKSVESDDFQIEKYRASLETAIKEIDIQKKVTETNRDTIVKVLDSHDKAHHGEVEGVALPFETFRRVVLMEDVDLMVIGARPAMGKTAWAISCASDWAYKMDLKVAIFALEMSKTQMMRRLLAHRAGVNSNSIKYGEMNEKEHERVCGVWTEKMDNITIIEGSQSVDDIASEVTRLKMDTGVDVVIVDYLQKVRPSHSGQSMYEAVTKASNGLKSISQNLHIPVMALAQLSRDSAKVGKRPSLPDLRQSGEIEQDASIVGFIHRPEYYGETEMESGVPSHGMAEIIIGKNREGDCGVYEMTVDLSTSKFKDIGYEAIREQSHTSMNQHQPDEENPF
jgi:replicative DNA helicase